jgi:hypothetical protein
MAFGGRAVPTLWRREGDGVAKGESRGIIMCVVRAARRVSFRFVLNHLYM